MSKIKARKFEQSQIDKKRKLKTWKKEQPGRTSRQIDPFQLSFVKVLQFRKFTLKITPWWTRMEKEIQFWFWCWNPFEVDKSRIKKSFVILIVFFVIFLDNTWYILDNFFLHFTGKHWNLWGRAAGGFLIDLPPATIRNWLLSVAPKLKGFLRKKKNCNET